ncbi:hypothetical protein [Nonomuraea sp. MG754425]|nr:hypothetical protein [Nonomuraea sp. MG754425]
MRIESVRLARHAVPLERPVSDAKVATGRQRPLSQIDMRRWPRSMWRCGT